jgi:diguanylate cyclase (GGDEF)-like protein
VTESVSTPEKTPLRPGAAEIPRVKALDLLNRGQILDRIGRELSRTKACIAGRSVVLSIDLDRFKIVTASLGRRTGDELLAAIARRINGLLGTRDSIARVGGDEFVIMLEEPAPYGAAIEVAERIQKELIGGFNLETTVVYTTASIGVARISSSYASPEDILRDAEIAMYHAKARGRARAEVFHPGMHANAIDMFELETDLRRAVERKEFELFYQPIVSAVNGRVRAFESLLRWRHPSRGILSPGAFLDLLKETGLIVPVGEWVINEACRQARIWQEVRLRPVPVTINLAPQQFTHANVVKTVTEAIESSGVDPMGIVLELTEDAILEDLDSARETLAPLRARGVRIMIDDFGTGYSSLSYLRRLSVDAIKIDASFVDRIEKFTEDRMIVRAIVALAHALELCVVAEGIERKEQLAELVNLECEEVQGYMISQPVDAETATRMIEGRWAAQFAIV